MREKTVKRYYCEHCGKGMFKKPSMFQHEVTCIANPKRACFLCNAPCETFDYRDLARQMKLRNDVEQEQTPYGDKTDFHVVTNKAAIDWAYSKVDGCPCCVLAVFRQGKIMAFDVFDYKEHLAAWHREQTEGIGLY